MKVGKFSWSEIGVEAIYKQKSVPVHPPTKHNTKLLDNVTAYVHWVMGELRCSADHSPDAHYEKWNACAIYMNKQNVDFLSRCFRPLDWLNLSPCVDDSLGDDEYGILEEEVITQCLC